MFPRTCLVMGCEAFASVREQSYIYTKTIHRPTSLTGERLTSFVRGSKHDSMWVYLHLRKCCYRVTVKQLAYGPIERIRSVTSEVDLEYGSTGLSPSGDGVYSSIQASRFFYYFLFQSQDVHYKLDWTRSVTPFTTLKALLP